MTPFTRKQIITVFIFPNMSRRKDNQTITFGRFVEYNVRNRHQKNQAENETSQHFIFNKIR